MSDLLKQLVTVVCFVLVRQILDFLVEARLEFGNAFIDDLHYFFFGHGCLLLVARTL